MGELRIFYKSGNSIDVKVDRFKVTRNGLGEKSFEWSGMKPDALFLGPDDVEAVYQLD